MASIEYGTDSITIKLKTPSTVTFFKTQRQDGKIADYIAQHFDEWVVEMDAFIKNYKKHGEKSSDSIRWFEEVSTADRACKETDRVSSHSQRDWSK